MKVTALLPFKNEAPFLPTYLSNVLPVVDEIIAVDDNSTDNSAEILTKAGAVVYSARDLQKFSSGWSEGPIRQKTLTAALERGATHLVCLDADETFTSNFVEKAREYIFSLRPGEKLSLQWLALWKSTTHYRDDNTVWSNNWKDFAVCYTGDYGYNTGQHMHHGRTPGLNEDTGGLPWKKVPLEEGGVLHYQFSFFNNFQLKQSWLRCSELIENPNQFHSINQKYYITLLDELYIPQAVAVNTKMPDSWTKGIPTLKLPNYDPEWEESNFLRENLLPEILEWFEKYGVEFFEPLHIWQVPQLREEFVKKTGRLPALNQ